MKNEMIPYRLFLSCTLFIGIYCVKQCQERKSVLFIMDSTNQTTSQDFGFQLEITRYLLNEFVENHLKVSVHVYDGNESCEQKSEMNIQNGFREIDNTETIESKLNLLQYKPSDGQFQLSCIQRLVLNDSNVDRFTIAFARYESARRFLKPEEHSKYKNDGRYFLAFLYNSNASLVDVVARRDSNINDMYLNLMRYLCVSYVQENVTTSHFSESNLHTTFSSATYSKSQTSTETIQHSTKTTPRLQASVFTEYNLNTTFSSASNLKNQSLTKNIQHSTKITPGLLQASTPMIKSLSTQQHETSSKKLRISTTPSIKVYTTHMSTSNLFTKSNSSGISFQTTSELKAMTSIPNTLDIKISTLAVNISPSLLVTLRVNKSTSSIATYINTNSTRTSIRRRSDVDDVATTSVQRPMFTGKASIHLHSSNGQTVSIKSPTNATSSQLFPSPYITLVHHTASDIQLTQMFNKTKSINHPVSNTINRWSSVTRNTSVFSKSCVLTYCDNTDILNSIRHTSSSFLQISSANQKSFVQPSSISSSNISQSNISSFVVPGSTYNTTTPTILYSSHAVKTKSYTYQNHTHIQKVATIAIIESTKSIQKNTSYSLLKHTKTRSLDTFDSTLRHIKTSSIMTTSDYLPVSLIPTTSVYMQLTATAMTSAYTQSSSTLTTSIYEQASSVPTASIEIQASSIPTTSVYTQVSSTPKTSMHYFQNSSTSTTLYIQASSASTSSVKIQSSTKISVLSSSQSSSKTAVLPSSLPTSIMSTQSFSASTISVYIQASSTPITSAYMQTSSTPKRSMYLQSSIPTSLIDLQTSSATMLQNNSFTTTSTVSLNSLYNTSLSRLSHSYFSTKRISSTMSSFSTFSASVELINGSSAIIPLKPWKKLEKDLFSFLHQNITTNHLKDLEWGNVFITNSSRLLKQIHQANGVNKIEETSLDILDFIEDVLFKIGENIPRNQKVLLQANELVVEISVVDTKHFNGYSFAGVGQRNDIEKMKLPKAFFNNSRHNHVTIVGMSYKALPVMKKTKKHFEVADTIMAISIKPSMKKKFKDPLTYTLKVKENNFSNYECVYWNKSIGWSTEGCNVSSATKNTVTCECTHMTSFSVLMQVTDFKISSKHRFILSIISYIGCGVSIVACLLLIIAYMMCGRLVKMDRNIIHMNLALAIAVANAFFICADSVHEYEHICLGVSIGMYYTYLAAFFWMFVEGIHVYLMIVKVFKSPRKIRVYMIIGWVVPAIICFVTAFKFHDKFTRDDFCWLSLESHVIWIFVGPVLGVIFVNTIILIATLNASHKMSVDETEFGKLQRIARLTLVLMPIFGLTWVFGVIAINKQMIFFQYIFTAINSFQGLFIFICYCVINNELKREYQRVRRQSQYSSHKSNGYSDGFSTYIHPYPRKRIKSALSVEENMPQVLLTRYDIHDDGMYANGQTPREPSNNFSDTLTKRHKKQYSIELMKLQQTTGDEESVCSLIPNEEMLLLTRTSAFDRKSRPDSDVTSSITGDEPTPYKTFHNSENGVVLSAYRV